MVLEIEDNVVTTNINFNIDDFVLLSRSDYTENQVSISFFETVIDNIPIIGSMNKMKKSYYTNNRTGLLISTGALGYDVITVGTSTTFLSGFIIYETITLGMIGYNNIKKFFGY